MEDLADAESESYFALALAFRRSAQYFVIRSDTAFRAAADMRLVRLRALAIARPTARRLRGSANSGNVRSMATISARSCFNTVSAPARANVKSCPLCSRFAKPSS